MRLWGTDDIREYIYIYISHRFGPYTKLLKNLSKWKEVPVPIQAYVCCQNRPIEILFYSNLQLGLGVGHITLPPIMGCSENLGKSGIFFHVLISQSTSRNLWCPPDIRPSLGGFQPKVAGYSLEAERFQPQVVPPLMAWKKRWHGWVSSSMMFHEW